MRELPETQGLQVTRQSRHHAQQQLRKMLRLDFDVRLLEKVRKTKKWGEEFKVQLFDYVEKVNLI